MNMSITTIRPAKKSINYKIIGLVILFLSIKVTIISLFQDQISESLGIYKKGSISINTFEPNSEVYINNKLVGKAPIENYLVNPGLVNVTVKSTLNSQNSEYSTAIKVVDGSENFMYRELGISKELSSGVNIWEDQAGDAKVEIFLNPKDAKITVNQKEIPLSEISNLDAGEYNIKISKEGFQDLDFQAFLRPNFKTLIEAQLSPLPYDNQVAPYQNYENIYVIKSSNPEVYSYSKNWLEYLDYFQKSRGLRVSGLGLVKEKFFDYYVDQEGKVYDSNFKMVDNFDSIDNSNKKRFGLLHKGISRDVVTQKNSFTLLALLPKPKETTQDKEPFSQSQVLGTSTQTKKVRVTGEWLRIRTEPNGEEIGRAKEGETYELVSEEEPGWFKIKLDGDKTGYISILYSEIVK
jgi:hypothetical protein